MTEPSSTKSLAGSPVPQRVSYIVSQYPEFHETFVAREVEALCQAGIDVQVYSLKPPPPPGHDLYPEHRRFIQTAPFMSARVMGANLREALRAPGRYLGALVALVALYKTRPLELLKALAVFPKTVVFAARMREFGGVLHAHWATIPAAMAIVIKRLTGIRFSLTAHAWDIFLSPAQELNRKIAFAEGVVTCTGYNVGYLQRVCDPAQSGKIHLQYHGIDFSTIDSFERVPVQRERLDVIAVGRLVEQKGLVHLIRAVRKLGERGIPVRATIVGDGPLRASLESEARTLPANASVELSGRLPHTETIRRIQASHVMITPSVVAANGDRDGVPNVILEALACQVPVIASEVSGIPEVVIHGQTGWLVPSGDADALADAMEQAWRQPDRLRQMGHEGRRLMEQRFDMNANAVELLRLLGEMHRGASAPIG
jgi:glycosyltransferase involved in cell wall biosynthesis